MRSFNPTVKQSPKDFSQDVLDRIRSLALVFKEPSIPAMPSTSTDRLRTLESRKSVLSHDSGLLRTLQKQNYAAEHDCLVCAMYIHTLLVWRTQPALFVSPPRSWVGNARRQTRAVPALTAAATRSRLTLGETAAQDRNQFRLGYARSRSCYGRLEGLGKSDLLTHSVLLKSDNAFRVQRAQAPSK